LDTHELQISGYFLQSFAIISCRIAKPFPLKILIVDHGRIPAHLYGGTERVIWYLGQELSRRGHEVSYLVSSGSECPFASIIIRNPEVPLESQIPDDIDLIHFQYPPDFEPPKPYVVTNHGNRNDNSPFPLNTVFVSKNHAERYGSSCFVYNGLNWDDYGKPDLTNQRKNFHFLGNAAWRVKNVKGAIKTVLRIPKEHLDVLGGNRLNLKMGLRFTPQLRIHFHGMVGGEKKYSYLRNSKGLIFPVLWHEPFGLAIIESLYFGCPVFATPYGSLQELVPDRVGFLSNSSVELAENMKNADAFSKKQCHEWAAENFNANHMTNAYMALYEKVLNGDNLNSLAPQLIEKQPKFLPWNTL
jgi:glycosyltransferase involved in cell wall biosynthesis